jgi:hypothetical protein
LPSLDVLCWLCPVWLLAVLLLLLLLLLLLTIKEVFFNVAPSLPFNP